MHSDEEDRMVSTKDGALDELLRLRLTARQLTKLQSLADELNVTRSAAVRELIDFVVASGQPRLRIGTRNGGEEVANAR